MGDAPEKTFLYPTAASDEISATLPDAMSRGKWDYLVVDVRGAAQNGRFPVQISAYGGNIPPVSGWLDVDHIGFALQSSILYGKPDGKSAKKLILEGGDWLGERGDITLRDCKGEWVQIDYRQQERRGKDNTILAIPADEQQTLSGVWARGICPVMETTCDMEDADKQP